MQKITLNLDIKLQDVSDLLCSALEGGSNYWYMLEEKIEPKKWEYDSDIQPAKGNHWTEDYPLNEGGALIISDQEDETHGNRRLDLPAIKKGLQIMATKFPGHFSDILNENADATTGDVFLQCCLFGDVIYG
jgi:hypothetical protein